jgi:hypothetical protein
MLYVERLVTLRHDWMAFSNTAREGLQLRYV